MKIIAYPLIMMSIASLSVFAAENTETEGNHLLLESCQALMKTPEQENAKSCFYFIQGFLAAAHVVDPPVINQQTKKNRKSYGFMSRPYRDWEPNPPTRFFPFCIPGNESKARVIEVVSKQLTIETDTVKKLRNTIFVALESEYPCSKSKQNQITGANE